jgi:hypothetical protein
MVSYALYLLSPILPLAQAHIAAIIIDPTIGFSFFRCVLYVPLLLLVPAVLIFCLFPDTKATISRPLQNLTVNATGAFDAHVVTGLLGFFLVSKIETQIEWTKRSPIEGVMVELGPAQGVDFGRFYSRCFFNPLERSLAQVTNCISSWCLIARGTLGFMGRVKSWGTLYNRVGVVKRHVDPSSVHLPVQ